MSSKRRTYTEGYKREVVALYEAGERSAASLEAEYGIGRGNLWRWIKRYGFSEGGERTGSRTAEERQIRELERELEITRQERDIPETAVAIFSRPKQTGSDSSRPIEPNSW